MSDNVPLAQSPPRLSQPGPAAPPMDAEQAGAAQPPAWQRYQWLWDVHFAVVAVVTVVAVWMEDAGAGARTAAIGLVAALAVWYLLLGRGLIRRHEPRRWWWRVAYQIGVLALLVPAVSLVPLSSLVMFALVPQAIMMWPLLPAAVVVASLLATTWVVAPWLRGGELRSMPGALELVLLLGLTVVLSLYISRIAQQSGERAELIAQLANSRAEVARLSHEAGVAAERQRLAGDIHDTIAQGLSSVVMLVQSAQASLEREPAGAHRHLELALRTARENLDEARALVAALTPAELNGASLPEALRRLSGRCRFGVSVTVTGTPRSLPTAVEVVLWRAAQESLTNVDKHAASGAADLRLAYGEDAVTLEVTDRGAGFDPAQASDGYGLPAMRSRVAQVGGEVEVRSAPGEGTAVRVTVPA